MDDLSSSKYSIDCRSSSQSPRSQLVTGTDSRMSGMTERTSAEHVLFQSCSEHGHGTCSCSCSVPVLINFCFRT